MPEIRSWDGAAYDRLSTPMEEMGREVMDRCELRGDETVLDAGCGSGRLTERLIDRVPDGRVIGVDVSASMIDAARKRLGADADLRVADLVGLDLGGETVDVVFSTATFHWIADHDALFASLRAVLRPGGRLVAQCGGGAAAAGGGGGGATPRGPPRRPGGPRPPRRSVRTSRAGAGRGTSRRRRTPSAACTTPASPTRAAGSPSAPSSRTTRASTCARSTSARIWSACPRTCSTPSSTPSSPASASARRSTTCG